MKNILIFVFIFFVSVISYAEGNPFADGYHQKTNPFANGYIQDTNPFADGYVQDKSLFGK